MMEKKKQEEGEEPASNGLYEGYCADLAQKIAEVVQFNYELKIVADNKFGAEENGTWNGMVGELIRRVGTAQLVVVQFPLIFMFSDQELISYRYSSCCCSSSCCWGDIIKKPKTRRFKSDRDEIRQECSSSKYTSIDGVEFSI